MGHWSTGDLGTGHTDAGTESISRHGEGGTKNNKDSDDGDARSNDGRLEQRNHGSGCPGVGTACRGGELLIEHSKQDGFDPEFWRQLHNPEDG